MKKEIDVLKGCQDDLALLKARQGYSLEGKIHLTKRRIKEWYEYWNGQVYVSFSGGKDSTVLLHLVRSLYPDVPAVFSDTGLEYPEIKSFVKSIDNVIWLRPKMPFYKVLEKYGYPVVSKKVARFIEDLQNPTEKNKATRNLRLTGMTCDGKFAPSQKIPKKWLKLVDSEFKISSKCCDLMKKRPFKKYMKETGRKPITGIMTEESNMREKQYLKQGCNAFHLKTTPMSMPMAFWKEEDVWNYLKTYNVPYSKIYDMGEKRTGCMFCMFGCHLEKGENRFQRMKKSHPNQWKYCINTLKMGKILDLIGVKYE